MKFSQYLSVNGYCYYMKIQHSKNVKIQKNVILDCLMTYSKVTVQLNLNMVTKSNQRKSNLFISTSKAGLALS